MRNRPEQPSSNYYSEDESFLDKMKRMTTNCCRATGLCCFRVKEQSQVTALQLKVSQRKKKFGVDYMNLVEQNASQQALKTCFQEALDDISELRKQINEHHDKIDDKTEKVHAKINGAPGASTSASKAKPNKDGTKSPTYANEPKAKNNVAKPTNNNSKSHGNKNSANKTPITRNSNGKVAKPAANQSAQKSTHIQMDEEDPFSNTDPSKWKCSEIKYTGSAKYEAIGSQEKTKGKPITKGIKTFKTNPEKYVAMFYQTSMLEWPEDQQEYTYIHRSGTKGYRPEGVSKNGWMTMLLQEYEALPPFKDNELPKQHRDKYTDTILQKFCGKKLHSGKSNKPILPGRGMGICDAPNVKIIGDVDPSDIHQGQVGNCWMLSGISSLAEFDGGVKRLFRKTKNLHEMPRDGPNTYIITLWDLPTWTEVDIVIDERLCASPNGVGLLASKPSIDGELWVCYLEKALAAHCGGWDRIVGGQCTHAWALMTGCKEQYMISKNKRTGKYTCCGKYNRYENKWKKHTNSPHDCDQSMWSVPWPEVGGGGDKELDQEELFMRMCAWDDVNYIVGAGTTGVSDKHSTEGMVDNHAYSVIECINDVAGTDIDLIKVRNPWGKGEIEDGEFE